MLRPLEPEDALRLREFFAEAGYTHEQFQEQPGLREPRARRGIAPLEYTGAEEPTAFHALLRWFFLGLPQSRDAVRSLVPEPIVEIMTSCGLLADQSGLLEAAVMLTPCDGFLFAADPAARMNSEE